jgi:transcription antitermination factor NusA-like protein
MIKYHRQIYKTTSFVIKMVNTLDMQDLRYLNLFEKVTRIRTHYCFEYNNCIIFCVPREFVSQAIGPDARNLRSISEIIKKRVKVIAIPRIPQDIRRFIEMVVSPVTFKDLEVLPNEIVLNAGSQSKAALIGREKRRLMEMQKITQNFFKKDFRIV